MGRWLAQVGMLTAFNLRTLPQRKVSASVTVLGIAGVVSVMIGVLSIGQGFRRTMASAGSIDNAVVLRAGSDNEMSSAFTREQARVISEAPGVARDGGLPLSSPELWAVVDLPRLGGGLHVPMRGVEPAVFKVRDRVKLVEGRMFQPGRSEIIVGRGALAEFPVLAMGNELDFSRHHWKVVGVFEADGGLPESEMWSDAAVVDSAFGRAGTYQVVLVKLATAGSYGQFKDALTADPRLNVKVAREAEYNAEQSRLLTKIVTGLGGLVVILMATGAIFGALNTMYTAVAARGREIATLKALGFRNGPVIASVMIESLLLALAGGVVGALLAYLAFDGYRAATLNFQSFSQVAFAFRVDLPLVIRGILYATLIGLIGGLFPALRAARQPIPPALRAV